MIDEDLADTTLGGLQDGGRHEGSSAPLKLRSDAILGHIRGRHPLAAFSFFAAP